MNHKYHNRRLFQGCCFFSEVLKSARQTGQLIVAVIGVSLAALSCHNDQSDKTAAPNQGSSEKHLLASTRWTAAFVELAGAAKVKVLAGAAMPHPAEYELRAGDFIEIEQSDMIVVGGYESMLEKIAAGLGGNTEKIIRISTGYSRQTVRQSVEKIAALLGTQTKARANLASLMAVYRQQRQAAAELGWPGAKVVVHRFQKDLAAELGMEATAVFGPGPLEAAQIAALSRLENVTLVIDNLHNPVLEKVASELFDAAQYALCLNFPGLKNTQSLEDVLRYNFAQINQVMP